jgi:hypothetical protein
MSSAAPVDALEHVVTLRNGADLRLRPIRPDDAPGLIALCGRLSPRTIYQRFFGHPGRRHGR